MKIVKSIIFASFWLLSSASCYASCHQSCVDPYEAGYLRSENTVSYGNGDTYSGMWKYGHFNGQGKLFRKGNGTFTGTFENGLLPYGTIAYYLEGDVFDHYKEMVYTGNIDSKWNPFGRGSLRVTRQSAAFYKNFGIKNDEFPLIVEMKKPRDDQYQALTKSFYCTGSFQTVANDVLCVIADYISLDNGDGTYKRDNTTTILEIKVPNKTSAEKIYPSLNMDLRSTSL